MFAACLCVQVCEIVERKFLSRFLVCRVACILPVLGALPERLRVQRPRKKLNEIRARQEGTALGLLWRVYMYYTLLLLLLSNCSCSCFCSAPASAFAVAPALAVTLPLALAAILAPAPALAPAPP